MFQPEVADYRFERMVKNNQFAYASGLIISPAHLPKALSAMKSDGWNLISAIGDATDPSKVGFFFDRFPSKQEIADAFYFKISHGDAPHRQWLRDTCDEVALKLFT